MEFYLIPIDNTIYNPPSWLQETLKALWMDRIYFKRWC